MVLTCFGALQVAPPLVEVEIATSSKWPPLKRESCQTAYSWPVAGSMAGSGMMSPVRTASPVLGSVTPTVCMFAMTFGLVQVFPPSVDLTKASLNAVTLNGGVIRSKKS